MQAETADPVTSNGPTPDPGSRDRWIPRLVLGLLLGVAVWAGLLFYGDVGEIVAATRTIPLDILLGSLVLSTLNYFVRAVRWQGFLRTVGVRLPMGESTLVCLAGLSMTLTPMKVGEILKSALLKRSRGISIARTAPVVFAERITDLAAMVLLGSVGSLVLDRGVMVAALGTLFVAAIMAVCTVRPIGHFALRCAAHLPVLKDRIVSLRAAYDNLGVLVGWAPFVGGTALGVLAWGTHCLALWLLVASFDDAQFSIVDSLFAYATPLLAGTLSMLPGGLGLTEASMTGLLLELGGPGMSPAIAAVSTILIRLVTFWWAIVVGLGALAIWRRSY